MVECDLAKVEVAGSNPVSRSRYRIAPAEGAFLLRVGERGRRENTMRFLGLIATILLSVGLSLAQTVSYQPATILDIQQNDAQGVVHKQTDAAPPTEQARYDVKVQIGDTVYVCRYKHATDYLPSNWEVGKTVEGRVGPHKHRVYLKDVSGKEVALPIVTRQPAKGESPGK